MCSSEDVKHATAKVVGLIQFFSLCLLNNSARINLDYMFNPSVKSDFTASLCLFTVDF